MVFKNSFCFVGNIIKLVFLSPAKSHMKLLRKYYQNKMRRMNVIEVIILKRPSLTRAPFIFAYQIESWMFLTMIVNHKPMFAAVRQKPQPPQQGFSFNSFVTGPHSPAAFIMQ